MLTVGARLETVLLLERLGFCSKGAKSIFGEVNCQNIFVDIMIHRFRNFRD